MARRQKRLTLHLIDDDVHSVDDVIEMLISCIPECNELRAEQIAMLTHYNGSCQVYTGLEDMVSYLFFLLTTNGYHVSLENVKK